MILLAALLLQTQSTVSVGVGTKGASIVVKSGVLDDSTVRRDSIRREARRVVVTSEHLATAYKDASARRVIGRAREARLSQDSSIQSYEASTLQRMTMMMSLSRFGRERMLFRYESSSKIRWQRGVGASVEITGRRAVAPAFGKDVNIEVDDVLSPVPYAPGRDALWAGFTTVKDEIDNDGLIHPLATSAEAYYYYESGDSLRWKIPTGATIQLREVLVRPRVISWRALVGSLWFDAESGQLVRAAFKLSEPLDLWSADAGEDDPSPFMVRAMLDPMTASITGMAMEYSLHEGRFWMPRSQAFDGKMQVGFVTFPMQIEETFKYDGINIRDFSVNLPEPQLRRDSAFFTGIRSEARDSARGRLQQQGDSLRKADTEEQCRTTGFTEKRVRRHGGSLIVGLKVPCDSKALAESPTLPKSIFDANDEFFSDAQRDELLARAEQLLAIPTLGFYEKPTVKWTFSQVRFNRVEGLSSSVLVEQQIGRDMSLRFVPRIGVADRVANGELSLITQRAHSEIAVTGYRRLTADADWGNPLSFGSSLSALLFGRDEGMYYRGTGAEITGRWERSVRTFWSAYAQRESDAVARNTRSLPQLLGDEGFRPAANITAAQLTQYGGALRFVGSHGLNPNTWRALTDLRLDGATGDSTYGRGSLDLTIAHGFGGPYGASLTMSGGSSIGGVPVQRLYFLGGSPTVRGQTVGGMAGTAYWFGRAEIGKGVAGRRVLFADIGWAGDRDHLAEVGRPMSGVGIGFSIFDGLLRFDVARGLYPEQQFRVTLYMDSKY